MLDIGVDLLAPARGLLAARSGPAGVSFETIVIEGDSITSTTPYQSGSHGDFYSHRFADTHPERTVLVSAQASRTVGGPAANGDGADDGTPGGNTLLAWTDADLAASPDLLTVMIGANDLSTYSAETFLERLAAWAAPIRAAGTRIAFSPPTPREEGYGDYAGFMARWSALFGAHDIRNPAVWGQWADFYIPMGEHPDFRLSGFDWSLDGVHPSAPVADPDTGQHRLQEIYLAAMTSLLDEARMNAGAPYEAVWPQDEIELAPASPIERRFIVSGIAWTGLAAGAGVSGGGAQLRLNGGDWGTATGRIYNGDVIDLRLTASAEFESSVSTDLTIGSETRTLRYATAADLPPVSYTHGGIEAAASPASSLSITATFEEGLAVIGLSTGVPAASVEVDGVPAIRRVRQTRQSSNRGLEIWEAPVSAGERTVVATYGGYQPVRVAAYGTIVGGTFAATTPGGEGPPSESNPHRTAAFTVPASGLALAMFAEYGGAASGPSSCNVPTVEIDRNGGVYNSELNGLCLGVQTDSGQASFDFTDYGSFARAAVIYRAA